MQMPGSAELVLRNALFEDASPEAILRWTLDRVGSRVAFGTAFGATGMVLLDVISRAARDLSVFTIDTGYLFDETQELKRRVERKYGIWVETISPEFSVSEQDRAHGPQLYQMDPDRCCRMRKVEPLQRKLAGLDGWITSLRRDQGDSRTGIRILEAYETQDGRPLLKINPLAAWSRKQVWGYILTHDVPYNPLLDQGYPSIGCRPCTRAVGNGVGERSGRWAGSDKTECGIHTFMALADSDGIDVPPVQIEEVAAD